MMKKTASAQAIVVSQKDLPIYCPMHGKSLWDKHPRVYLEIFPKGNVTCPYCGTLYKWDGPVPENKEH